MNIKEIEKLTGISKQNIRYYEANGLLKPKRNKENNYREYDMNDVSTLNKIKLLRKLDFSIIEIEHMIQTNEIKNVENHINKLKAKLDEYNNIINVCEELKSEEEFDLLDEKRYLDIIADNEKSGITYRSFVDDFKIYLDVERMKEFTFFPDNMCITKEEFTESLIKYADLNKLDLIITKESLSPEFTLNGIPYKASRYTGRFGAYVICEVSDETYLPKLQTTLKRKRLFKFMNKFLLPMLLIILLSLPVLVSEGPIWTKILLFLGEAAVFLAYFVVYGKNISD